MVDAFVIIGVTIFILLFVDLNAHRRKMLRRIDEIKHSSPRQKRGAENASYG